MKTYKIYAVRLQNNNAKEPEDTGLEVNASNKKQALIFAKNLLHNLGRFYSYSAKGVFVVNSHI